MARLTPMATAIARSTGRGVGRGRRSRQEMINYFDGATFKFPDNAKIDESMTLWWLGWPQQNIPPLYVAYESLLLLVCPVTVHPERSS